MCSPPATLLGRACSRHCSQLGQRRVVAQCTAHDWYRCVDQVWKIAKRRESAAILVASSGIFRGGTYLAKVV
jgi:hypothetical protein